MGAEAALRHRSRVLRRVLARRAADLPLRRRRRHPCHHGASPRRPRSGERIRGARVAAPGQLGRPHNLTVDPSGNIFVGEAARPRGEGSAHRRDGAHGVSGAEVQAGRHALMLGLTRLLRGLGFGTAAAFLALLIGLGGFVRTAEMKLYDWRVRSTTASREASTGPGVVLVNIDDDSMRRMEPLVGRWPWPRLVHASLIDYLAAGGAKAVCTTCCSPRPIARSSWSAKRNGRARSRTRRWSRRLLAPVMSIHVAEAASAELLDPTQRGWRGARRRPGAESAVHGGPLRRAPAAGHATVPGAGPRVPRHRPLARGLRRGRPASAGGAVRASRTAPRESGVGSRAAKRNTSSRHYPWQR